MGGSDDRPMPSSGRPDESGPSTPTTRREIHGGGRSHGAATDGHGWRRWTVVGLVAGLVLVVGGVAVAAWHLNSNISKLDVSAGIGTDRPTQAAGTDRAPSTSCSSAPTRATARATTATATTTTSRATTPTPTCSCTSPPTARRPRWSRSPATRWCPHRPSAPPPHRSTTGSCASGTTTTRWADRAASSGPSRATPASSSTTTPSWTSAASSRWSMRSAGWRSARPRPSATPTPPGLTPGRHVLDGRVALAVRPRPQVDR